MIEILSAREKDVARLLANGVSNKEIARALGVEVVTVKKHVGNIFRKLGARNRTQAAVSLAERKDAASDQSSGGM
jgi:DNA-binding NarL/FixJ family response regulator